MGVILRPIISERSMSLTKADFYTFEVEKSATKRAIEKIVEDKFKVDVLKVKIINVHSKRKIQRTRRGYFNTPSFKKAIVKLKKGQKIPLFEQVSEEEAKVTTAETEPEVKEKKSLLRGTKVKIESTGQPSETSLAKGGSPESREKQQKKTDPKRPTKRSQKEKKKGGK